MKKLLPILLLLAVCSLAAAPKTHITIYTQGWSFIQEERDVTLDQPGESTITLGNLPMETDQSSILVHADDFNILSKEFIIEPISVNNLLKANVGNEIQLVKYTENGDIGYSTVGRLISFDISPVFEIDGLIVLEHPYNYLFKGIPDGLSDAPRLVCRGITSSLEHTVDLSYLARGLDWYADYSLELTGDSANLESWFTVKNNNRVSYENAGLTLVSGSINFAQQQSRGPAFLAKMDRSMMAEAAAPEAYDVGGTEDHILFNIPYAVSISERSTKQLKYVTAKNFPFVRSYHSNHALYYGSRKISTEPVPVSTRITFDSEEIGDYNLPAGTARVYENTESRLIFVGSDNIPTIQNGDDFKIQTGKTMDVTAEFTLESFEINRSNYEHKLSAKFKNAKDKAVTVEWLETITGEWELKTRYQNWDQKDASTARFLVDIPAKGEKEIIIEVKVTRK